jgi:hypothetical protein
MCHILTNKKFLAKSAKLPTNLPIFARFCQETWRFEVQIQTELAPMTATCGTHAENHHHFGEIWWKSLEFPIFCLVNFE